MSTYTSRTSGLNYGSVSTTGPRSDYGSMGGAVAGAAPGDDAGRSTDAFLNKITARVSGLDEPKQLKKQSVLDPRPPVTEKDLFRVKKETGCERMSRFFLGIFSFFLALLFLGGAVLLFWREAIWRPIWPFGYVAAAGVCAVGVLNGVVGIAVSCSRGKCIRIAFAVTCTLLLAATVGSIAVLLLNQHMAGDPFHANWKDLVHHDAKGACEFEKKYQCSGWGQTCGVPPPVTPSPPTPVPTPAPPTPSPSPSSANPTTSVPTPIPQGDSQSSYQEPTPQPWAPPPPPPPPPHHPDTPHPWTWGPFAFGVGDQSSLDRQAAALTLNVDGSSSGGMNPTPSPPAPTDAPSGSDGTHSPEASTAAPDHTTPRPSAPHGSGSGSAAAHICPDCLAIDPQSVYYTTTCSAAFQNLIHQRIGIVIGVSAGFGLLSVVLARVAWGSREVMEEARFSRL